MGLLPPEWSLGDTQGQMFAWRSLVSGSTHGPTVTSGSYPTPAAQDPLRGTPWARKGSGGSQGEGTPPPWTSLFSGRAQTPDASPRRCLPTPERARFHRGPQRQSDGVALQALAASWAWTKAISASAEIPVWWRGPAPILGESPVCRGRGGTATAPETLLV